MIIRIVGAPATGKTTLRHWLADYLALPHFGIDDERLFYGWSLEAWQSLKQKVDQTAACILETGGTTQSDRVVCSTRSTFTILCTASRQTRHQRLVGRVEQGYPLVTQDDYATRLLKMGAPLLTPHASINSDNGFNPNQLEALALRCNEFIDEG